MNDESTTRTTSTSDTHKPTDLLIELRGLSGTGKTLIAYAIYNALKTLGCQDVKLYDDNDERIKIVGLDFSALAEMCLEDLKSSGIVLRTREAETSATFEELKANEEAEKQRVLEWESRDSALDI